MGNVLLMTCLKKEYDVIHILRNYILGNMFLKVKKKKPSRLPSVAGL